MTRRPKNWAMLVAMACVLAVGGRAAELERKVLPVGKLTVLVSESILVDLPGPASRVAVTDPTVVNVQILTPTQLLIQGLKIGSTDLVTWNEDEQPLKSRIVVIIDIDRFKAELAEWFPLSEITPSYSGEVLILRGLLRSAEQATLLHNYLEGIGAKYVDMTSVAGVQQVQIQVRVAEVSRMALRMLGINFFNTTQHHFLVNRLGGNQVANIGIPGGTAVEDLPFQFLSDTAATQNTTLLFGFPKAELEFFVQALEENQYLRVLATPTLVAASGEQADFLAGGEYPIPVVQGSGGGAGGGNAVTIEYRPYGVTLLFEPVVLGDGTIRLRTSQEVSDLTDVGAVTIQGFTVPALLTRKASTTLELNSGQTFAMAGMIKSNVDAVRSAIPVLGSIPVIGPLFRSIRYQTQETELVFLVTASLVEPLSIGYETPVPGFLHSRPRDWELYIDGRIDGRQAPAIDKATGDWLKRNGLHDLFGPGAWDYYTNRPAASQAHIEPWPRDADPVGGNAADTVTE